MGFSTSPSYLTTLMSLYPLLHFKLIFGGHAQDPSSGTPAFGRGVCVIPTRDRTSKS